MEGRHLVQIMLQRVLRLPTMHLDATDQQPRVWAAALVGASLGLGWGLIARIWMRLISTSPDFSVAGTVAILVITTVFGICTGVAFAARRRGWRRWGHYLPRGLVVFFFIPFGMAGGMPLMLTILLATIAVTQQAVIGIWVVTVLAILAALADAIPWVVAAGVLAVALALTIWKWLLPRWHGLNSALLVDAWLERIVRAIVLLLAIFGFGFVAREIITDKPGILGALYVLFYVILLYPLFLALRVGLEKPHETTAASTQDY